jgi:hypothetical protein
MREDDERRGEEAVWMDGSIALADSPAGCDLVMVGRGPVAVEDFPAVALAGGEVNELSADGCLTVLGWAAREKARLDATMLRVQARFTECRPPRERFSARSRNATARER